MSGHRSRGTRSHPGSVSCAICTTLQKQAAKTHDRAARKALRAQISAERADIRQRRSFGQITRLPSGRWRARYTGPDTELHNGPSTFDTKQDAEAWLTDERRLVSAGVWQPPSTRKQSGRNRLTFGRYADAWLRDRDLKPRTRQHYRSLLDRQLFPTFEAVPLADITPESVRTWHALTGPAKPTLRAHAYGLLRTILGTAEADGLVASNPCHIRAGGNAKRVHKVKPLSLDELGRLVEAMPDRYRVMTLLAAWCALRFGELAELRRKDLDLRNGIIHVRRGVVRVDGKAIVGTPKTDAGVGTSRSPRT